MTPVLLELASAESLPYHLGGSGSVGSSSRRAGSWSLQPSRAWAAESNVSLITSRIALVPPPAFQDHNTSSGSAANASATSGSGEHCDLYGSAFALVLLTHSLVLAVLLCSALRIIWMRFAGRPFAETNLKRDTDASDPAPSAVATPTRTRLPHFDAIRFLFAFLIVILHVQEIFYAPETHAAHATWAHHLLTWPQAMVAFFIVLSGFVSQWTAPAGVAYASLGDIARFYARRLTRVMLVSWLSLVYMLAVQRPSVDGGTVLAQFLMLYQWWAPVSGEVVEVWWHLLNPPLWTVGVLVPCWVLFPASQWLLTRIEERGGAAGLAGTAMSLLVLAAVRVLAIAYDPHCTAAMQADRLWAPNALGDFLLGMLAASMARRHVSMNPCLPSWALGASCTLAGYQLGGYSMRGVLADAVAVSITLSFVLTELPADDVRESGQWSMTVQQHVFAAPFALFMYASAGGGTAGVVARLLSNRALVALGDYAFTVYLLQWPFLTMLRKSPGLIPYNDPTDHTYGLWVALMLTGLSMLVTELFERPLTRLALLLCMKE